MAKLELTKMVSAPAQVVFDYVDDHANYPGLMQGFSGFEATTPKHEIGTRLKMVGKAAGISMPMVLETTAVEPGRRIKWRYVAGMDGAGEWLFEPVGDATRVTVKVDYTPPMGVLGQIADRLVLERDIRENLEKTLEILDEKVGHPAPTG